MHALLSRRVWLKIDLHWWKWTLTLKASKSSTNQLLFFGNKFEFEKNFSSLIATCIPYQHKFSCIGQDWFLHSLLCHRLLSCLRFFSLYASDALEVLIAQAIVESENFATLKELTEFIESINLLYETLKRTLRTLERIKVRLKFSWFVREKSFNNL